MAMAAAEIERASDMHGSMPKHDQTSFMSLLGR